MTHKYTLHKELRIHFSYPPFWENVDKECVLQKTNPKTLWKVINTRKKLLYKHKAFTIFSYSVCGAAENHLDLCQTLSSKCSEPELGKITSLLCNLLSGSSSLCEPALSSLYHLFRGPLSIWPLWYRAGWRCCRSVFGVTTVPQPICLSDLAFQPPTWQHRRTSEWLSLFLFLRLLFSA